MEATEETTAAIGVDATEEKTIAATQVEASAWGRHVQHQPFRWFEATKDEAAAAAIQVEPAGEEKTAAIQVEATKEETTADIWWRQQRTQQQPFRCTGAAKEETTTAIQVGATKEGP